MKMGYLMKAFVTVAVFACVLTQCQEKSFAQVSVKEQQNQQNQISVTYPQFAGIENDYVQKKINMDIKVKVDKFVDQMQRNQYNQEAKVGYKVHYISDEKISFELVTYTYNGGAHGMTLIEGYTYNLQTGEKYSLTQLFDFRPSEINQKIFAYAKVNDVFLFGDFKGVKVYPDNFYLTEQGQVIILFQQYEIAPYSSGIIRIAMN